MSVLVSAIRTGLKLSPPPIRERWAVRLFLTRRDHGEPERERAWRTKGTEVMVAGHAGVRFGDGPVVLLAHGWEGRGLQLSAYIEPLVDAGHTVIALDGPGHGRSPGIGALPPYAAFLEEAIQEVDPVAIVAHSFGATASIVAAARTGFKGKILCLGGPPETDEIFTRARAFMGLPESGRPLFMSVLAKRFQDYPWQDLFDIAERAREWDGDIHGLLAEGDDDIPVEESKRIIEAAGGRAEVLSGPTHRNIMWDPVAVEKGCAFLVR